MPSSSGPSVGATIPLRVSKVSDAVEQYSIVGMHPLQELWDGFGMVSRVECKSTNGTIRTVIAKHISPPKLKESTWNTKAGVGHLRKLDSFCRELNTYLSHPLFTTTNSKDAVPSSNTNKVPLLLHFDTNLAPPFDSGAELTHMTIWLEDMCESDHTVLTKRRPMSKGEVHRCLDWLVWLHAGTVNTSTTANNRGTYWYLQTRPHELEWLQGHCRSKSVEEYLCANATSFSSALDSAAYKCTVHGDPKPPNFLMTKDGSSLAGVDFQYTGMGCGPQDVVYLLKYDWESNGGTVEYLKFWAYYFEHLTVAIASRHDLTPIQRNHIITEWKELAPVALSDFARFYSGWSQCKVKDAFTEAEVAIIESTRKGGTNPFL